MSNASPSMGTSSSGSGTPVAYGGRRSLVFVTRTRVVPAPGGSAAKGRWGIKPGGKSGKERESN